MSTAKLIGLSIGAALLLTMGGCSCKTQYVRQTVNPALTQDCPPLPDPKPRPDGTRDMGTLLAHDVEVVQLYGDCARSKAALIEAVK